MLVDVLKEIGENNNKMTFMIRGQSFQTTLKSWVKLYSQTNLE